ncbi:MAG: DUF3795 domain-containing protein [Methanobacteriota archaeon]|nr:MAG: DUF3795 domain-containing protein [Euryarchaeota archaeon]
MKSTPYLIYLVVIAVAAAVLILWRRGAVARLGMLKGRGASSMIEFRRPEVLTGACGYNCIRCGEYKDGLCKGCEKLNEESDEKCDIYVCVDARGFKTCLNCREYPNCDRYMQTISKTHCPVDEEQVTGVNTYRFVNSISATAVIKYKPTTRFEGVIQSVVNTYLTKHYNVLLVSSATRTEIYAKAFSESILNGSIKLVRLSASAKTESFYRVEKKKPKEKETVEDKVIEISVDWLEYLSEVIENLPKKSAIVFEPLSDIILINGFDKTFKFIKKTIDYCIGEGIEMVAFINDDAHEEMVKASFEGLFTNIAEIYGEEFRIIK